MLTKSLKKIRELIKKIREVYRMIIRIKKCIETEGIKDCNEKERFNMENRKHIRRPRNFRGDKKK